MMESRIIWVGHGTRTEEMRNTYNILVGKPEGKRTLRRSKPRWEDNIRLDHREIG
jgi:mannose/fructose-specific phosphotransferase system component IIA